LFGTKRLVDAVGTSMAKHMLFTATTLDAEAALGAGLVDQLHDGSVVADAVRAYAEKICSLSRYSTLATKKIVGMILDGTVEESEETRQIFLDAFQGKDFKEGRAAFLEKRKPKFTFKG
jgi:enoyl-CoA hydratase/carnithine racemase